MLSVIYGFKGRQRWNDKLQPISFGCVEFCLLALFGVVLSQFTEFTLHAMKDSHSLLCRRSVIIAAATSQ